MYARLCQRLSKEAPNFETPPEPCTFRLLLVNKCRNEFENRSQANDAFDQQEGPLGPEDEERQQTAKRKMLGNIKFIGELGKLEILGESILHLCIRQLLQAKSKRDRETRSCDMTEDLELLCQIMRTCGRNLDVKGKNLMDQYFQRMTVHAENPKLPIRIRFMLRDVMELRMCGWVPREATNTEGPKPMHQIQTNDSRGSSKGNQKHANFNGNNDFPVGSYNRPMRNPLDYNMPNYKNNMQNGDYNYVPQRQYQDQGFHSGGKQPNFQRKTGQQQHYNNVNVNSVEQNSKKPGYNKDLPPNFTDRMKYVTQPSPLNLDKVSLRPSPQSMLFHHPHTLKSTPGGTGGLSNQNLSKKPIESMSQQIFKEPLSSLAKQASFEKNKKEKVVVKEETVESLSEVFYRDGNLAEIKQKIPDKLVKPFLQAVMLQALDKNDLDRENVCSLLTEVMKLNQFNSSQFLDVYRHLLTHVEEKDVATFHSYVAGYACYAVGEGFVSLAKVADVAGSGAHLPLFLVLQQLHKAAGEAKLLQMFNESKLNLLKLLPEAERNKEHLFKILEDRNLGFVLPLLGIQAELWKQIQVDSNPTVFYKWVKENIDVAHQTKPEFIGALMTVVLKHIIMESAQKQQAMESLASFEKSAMDKELALLEKFKGVLQAFINESVNLQVTALYALQTLCFSLDFPKGLMLRWFVNLYQLEIIEEEAFLKWKEDVTDEYPGKGKALFQVNQWLVWLESAESEGEDDD